MAWLATIGRHPARHALFAHAASLDSRAPVSAPVARHVAGCPRCAAEVAAIRATLAVAAAAKPLEPDPDLTARILLEARKARAAAPARRGRATALVIARGAAYATAAFAVTLLIFGAALGNPAIEAEARNDAPVAQAAADAGPSPESMRKAADTVKTLSQAVRLAGDAPQSREEREKLRAVDAMDADIVAAREALERNPGCVRASHIVHANLQRQAKTLRDLYVKRAF